MRKFLAAALACCISLGALMVSASAAFTDEDQIVHRPAVETCTQLHIISGYEDGSFQPARGISRGEFATMIATLLWAGEKEDVPVSGSDQGFQDVAGHWARNYVLYCYDQGIVSGVGQGYFRPDGGVTGEQAAKMLLICLGYEAKREGFVGSDWAANVNARAQAEGLYHGLAEMDASAALSRDNAAQMIYNALYARTVSYGAGGTMETGLTLLEREYGITPPQSQPLQGDWTSFIQDVNLCRFQENGTAQWLTRLQDDPYREFRYTLDGDRLTFLYSDGTQVELDYITLAQLRATPNYDPYAEGKIAALGLPEDFRFFYQTNWDSTDPFGNAEFLVPAEVITPEHSEYWYQVIQSYQ